MSAPDPIALAESAGAILTLIESSDYVGAAKQAIELGLDLVPVDQLKQYLTDAGARRAETAANVAEDLKVGPETP